MPHMAEYFVKLVSQRLHICFIKHSHIPIEYLSWIKTSLMLLESSQSCWGKKWWIRKNLSRQSGLEFKTNHFVVGYFCVFAFTANPSLMRCTFVSLSPPRSVYIIFSSAADCFLVYNLAIGFAIHCKCSCAKPSAANRLQIPHLHCPATRLRSLLTVHSRSQGCWSPSHQSWAKRQSYTWLNVHVIGRLAVSIFREGTCNPCKSVARSWLCMVSEGDCRWMWVRLTPSELSTGQQLICIALTFICSLGANMNEFTGAVAQPLHSAPMCQQIISIKEMQLSRLAGCIATFPSSVDQYLVTLQSSSFSTRLTSCFSLQLICYINFILTSASVQLDSTICFYLLRVDTRFFFVLFCFLFFFYQLNQVSPCPEFV